MGSILQAGEELVAADFEAAFDTLDPDLATALATFDGTEKILVKKNGQFYSGTASELASLIVVDLGPQMTQINNAVTAAQQAAGQAAGSALTAGQSATNAQTYASSASQSAQTAETWATTPGKGLNLKIFTATFTLPATAGATATANLTPDANSGYLVMGLQLANPAQPVTPNNYTVQIYDGHDATGTLVYQASGITDALFQDNSSFWTPQPASGNFFVVVTNIDADATTLNLTLTALGVITS